MNDDNIGSLADLLEKCDVSEEEYINILKTLSSRTVGIVLKV